MILSRYLRANLGGSIHLYMTNTTIPIFGGKFTQMYKKTRLAYTVSEPKNPNNYPVYVSDKELGNFILSIDDDFEECIDEENKKIEVSKKNREGMWKMFFDGASSCEGEGTRFLFVAPGHDKVIPFSYILQLEVDYMNNVCEYEALVIGLEAARKLKIEDLIV
jgi:hypothetical protein